LYQDTDDGELNIVPSAGRGMKCCSDVEGWNCLQNIEGEPDCKTGNAENKTDLRERVRKDGRSIGLTQHHVFAVSGSAAGELVS
jgi:hypothetical protein